MLMSTGLTFGTISALFGLTHGIIDQLQYSVLATVVIASAVVPTIIAQTFFSSVGRKVEQQESARSRVGGRAIIEHAEVSSDE